MAGDWIKVEKSTCFKPEILRIAGELGVHPDHAIGLCIRFWSWCDDQLENGDIVCVTEDMLDALFGRTGFAKSLTKVNWLRVRSGSLEVPNFDRHLSESAKKRSVSRETSKKHRSSKRDTDGDKNVTSGCHQRREEKRRVVKGKPLTIPFDDEEADKNPIVTFSENAIPDALRSTGFCDAWKAWLGYRHQSRKPVRLEGQNQAFKRALEIGGDVAAEKLKVAMSNGYQGWDFNDRNGTSGKSSSVTASQRYSE